MSRQDDDRIDQRGIYAGIHRVHRQPGGRVNGVPNSGVSPVMESVINCRFLPSGPTGTRLVAS
jgi:hypothetical protein